MKRLFLIITTLFLAQSAWSQSVISTMMTTNIKGKIRSLTDYVAPEGYTVFVFWKTCCPNNLSMLDNLIAVIGEDKSPRYVIVSVDDPRSVSRVKPVISSYGWTGDVILDSNQEISRKLNAMTSPQWVVVNSEKEEVMRCKIGSSYTDVELYVKKIKNLTNGN